MAAAAAGAHNTPSRLGCAAAGVGVFDVGGGRGGAAVAGSGDVGGGELVRAGAVMPQLAVLAPPSRTCCAPHTMVRAECRHTS